MIPSITETNTGAVAQQPYGHQKDETFRQGLSVLGEHECRHKNAIKQCVTCLEYQQTQPQEYTISHFGFIQTMGDGWH